MTLHTRVAVVQPVPVRELFDFINVNLLGATEEQQKRARDEVPSYALKDGSRTLGNPPGVGLNAWLWLSYRPDGMLHEKALTHADADPDYYADASNWDSEEVWQEARNQLYCPATAIEVNFDTGYGYRADNGAGCGDLHAWLVREITRWLDDRGVDSWWYDEFSDEWFHHDLDALTRPRYQSIFGDPDRGALREVVST
jgi:hypothetical protein